jgi:hypothetical protein
LPEAEEATLATVKGRTDCDIGDFKVRISRGEHQRIDLCYVSPDISGPDDQDAVNAAFVATETLLGEDLLDRWIGAVAVAGPDDDSRIRSSAPIGRRPIGLDRLRETIQALISGMREQLPDRPQFERLGSAQWSVWKLDPGEAEDCFEQQDLIVVRSVNPDVWQAAHSGHLFFSERFSRCGETFCYVKLDGGAGLEATDFADKSAIEAALDQTLNPAGLGCVIGGGTGKRYSYIDLALMNRDTAIQAVQQVLRAGKVSRNAWIQFFDADLGAEWVGICNDSPPPPIRFDE